jgi:hypothetical protein
VPLAVQREPDGVSSDADDQTLANVGRTHETFTIVCNDEDLLSVVTTSSVPGSVSLRFDVVYNEADRSRFATGLEPLRASIAAWRAHPPSGRTYVRLAYAGDRPPFAPFGQAPVRVDEPSLAVLAIAASDPRRHAGLATALGGPAGLAGVVDARPFADGVLVELDPRITPLAVLVDLVDVELGGDPGRTIVPLLGIDDETLARFAGGILGADIDRSRIVETYAEPLLSGNES